MTPTSRALAVVRKDEPAESVEPFPSQIDELSIPPEGGYLGVLQAIATAAAAGMGEGGAAVLLGGVTEGRFLVAAVAGAVPIEADEIVTIRDDRVIRDGDTIEISVLREVPATGGMRKGKRDGLVLFATPIELCGRELGELVLFGSRKAMTATGTREHLAALAKLAAPAAALGRVGSFEVHLAELGAVVEVGQVLTGLLDMEDVLSYVVYLAESLVGGHCASVALLSDDGETVVVGNSTGPLRGHEGESLPVANGLIGWVCTNNQAVNAANIRTDPRNFRLGQGLGPGIVVPITNVGKVIGAFIVARLEGSRPFPQECTGLLQQMAAYAAIAITNAETHRRQREVAETLRRQAAELELANTELNRSQQQLLIAEKMAALGRITAGIAHEINSPLGGVMNSLAAVRGYVEEYRSSIADPDITVEDHHAIAADILNALSTAEGAVTKVAQFVKSIKGQTRAGVGGTADFDPAAEIDSTIVLLQHELKRRRIGVFTEMERGLKLHGDQGKFGVVIQNLISNAMDAYEGEPGEVWVRARAEDARLLISVEDRGSGIPPEIRDRIFDYLFTTKDVGKGTGLGLAMVHSVVTTAYNGEVSLQSEVGVGTTFTLSIPLPAADTNHGA